MKPVRLAVVHHLPVERYPPVLNLIEFLQGRANVCVQVVSSPLVSGQECSTAVAAGIEPCLRRISSGGKSILARWGRTLLWHCRAALVLKRFRPDVVLSVEPHSALAVWIYFHLLRGGGKLLIQHYEYYSDADYRRRGNRLLLLNRLFERALFRKADRVTQTNSDRLRLFAADHPYLSPEQLGVWPNYPPKSWFKLPQRHWPVDPGGPLRLVVAGAVSLGDTYIGPLVEWVTSPQQTACTLDVYASSCDAETTEWLRSRCGERLRFHERGVPYSDLPSVLRTFDVGLILYRCRTVNFVWNATNKLFEYLTCSLDVWYPPCMLGVAPYARSTAAPRVLETDFENLTSLNLTDRQTRHHLPFSPWTTTCEQALQPLIQLLQTHEAVESTNQEPQIH